MNTSLQTVITVALIGLTLLMLAFAIWRLRKESRLNARTVLLGVVVPLASTAVYVYFAGTGQLFTALIAACVGAILGLGLAWLTVVKRTASGVVVRQSGLTLIIWAIAYAATSLAALFSNGQIQQLTMLGLAVTAGMAAGSQLGLYIRSRSAHATPEARTR